MRLLLIPFAAAALTVGCGEGHVLQSPTGPSSTVGSGTALTADDASAVATTASTDEFGTLARGGNGNGRGGGNGNGNRGGDESDNGGPGNSNRPENPGSGGPGRSHEDRVVGFVSATTVDSITVNGITVTLDPDGVIRHGHRHLTMGNIGVGDHVVARGTMTGTALVAVEIKVQNTNGEDDDDVGDALEISGTIAGFTGPTGCPVTTFTINGTTIHTSAATMFDDVTCATLANGNRVEVKGTRQADNSILATTVELQSGPNEVRGTVSELSGTGSCGTATPALTFKVTPTTGTAVTVKTIATTTFSGGTLTCATLANGQNVEVEGTTEADLSLTAASVELH
jgi:hypothetical protein